MPQMARILLVDDEEGVRNAIQRILTKEHEVVLAASGEEAITVLMDDQAFDLILCDLMMPELSGMDVFEEVQKQHPELAGKFVFITGGIFTPRASEFFKKVTNPKVEKPIDIESLIKLVNSAIQA